MGCISTFFENSHQYPALKSNNVFMWQSKLTTFLQDHETQKFWGWLYGLALKVIIKFWSCSFKG